MTVSSDFAAIIRFMWETAFRFMTAFYIPGTHITPLALLFFIACTTLALKFITNVFGIGNVSDMTYGVAKGVGMVNKQKVKAAERATARTNNAADVLNKKG